MHNNMETSRYAIESVSNALRLLLLFRTHDALRVTDVSNQLGVARSTAHRLLRTLAEHGFVQQERNSRLYRTGRAVMELRFSPSGHSDIRNIAHSQMARLSRQLNETINLLIIEGDDARFIDSIECDREVRVTGRTGALLPAHATAGGKVLLATLPPEEHVSVMALPLRKMTSATITNKKELQEELDNIKRIGYAINCGESLEGIHAVAVPVSDGRGRVVASLAVSVPSDRGGTARLRKLIPPLKEAAKAIQSQL